MTPQLANEIATVDALVEAMSRDTDNYAIRKLALAGMEGTGLFDRAVLPRRLVPLFESVIMALNAASAGDKQMYMALIRCAFHTTRLVGRHYEDEQKGGPQ